MRRLDRYILREWAVVFAMTLISLVGLQLLALVQNKLDNLRGMGADWNEVMTYFAVVLPSTLPTVIPISLAISILYSLGDLHRRQETTAMRAAGFSVWDISRSLWVMGAFLTATVFVLNAEVVPWSVEQSRLTMSNLKYEAARQQQIDEEDIGLLYNLTFYNEDEGRLWFINRFNEYNYRAYGVTISQLNGAQRETERIAANQGYYDDLTQRWVLQEGRITEFLPETGEAIRSQAFGEREFMQLDEQPDLMKFLEKKPKDLSFFQLSRLLGFLEADEDVRVIPYQVQYWSILFNPLRCLIVVGLTVPFALSGVRTNPFIGISKSAGLLLVYIVAAVICRLLAGGALSPLMAAAVPNILMVALAIWMTWRASKPA
ncbi:MAG: LptF/LptG family permease [Verrucomicrobiota bacterium JB022]|nr:LptF/LptG family permease [Verrucomicrobiota bacterium JB022]